MTTAYLVSYPRSGSNWLRNLIAHSVFETNGVATLAMDDEMITGLIPSLSKKLPPAQNPDLVNYLNGNVIFKTHDLPKDDNCRFLFVFRNPLHSCYSYAKFLNIKQNRKLDQSQLHTLSLSLLPQWIQFSDEALLKRQRSSSRSLFIGYKMLETQTELVLARTLEFFGVSASQIVLRSAIKSQSYGSRRARLVSMIGKCDEIQTLDTQSSASNNEEYCVQSVKKKWLEGQLVALGEATSSDESIGISPEIIEFFALHGSGVLQQLCDAQDQDASR